MIYGLKIKGNKIWISNQKLSKLLMSCFMEDVSDMMDEDLFDAGVLDSMGTVELIVEIENRLTFVSL